MAACVTAFSRPVRYTSGGRLLSCADRVKRKHKVSRIRVQHDLCPSSLSWRNVITEGRHTGPCDASEGRMCPYHRTSVLQAHDRCSYRRGLGKKGLIRTELLSIICRRFCWRSMGIPMCCFCCRCAVCFAKVHPIMSSGHLIPIDICICKQNVTAVMLLVIPPPPRSSSIDRAMVSYTIQMLDGLALGTWHLLALQHPHTLRSSQRRRGYRSWSFRCWKRSPAWSSMPTPRGAAFIAILMVRIRVL